MKKFVFSLEKVLNLKQQMLEVKKNEISQIQLKIKDIETQEQKIKNEFYEYDQQMKGHLEKGASPQKIMTYKLYFNSLISREKKLAKEKESYKKHLTKKRKELVGLKSEVSGLEKLEEKQRTEYKDSLRKAQERYIEEYVNQVSAAQ